jgi:hypothetical protein
MPLLSRRVALTAVPILAAAAAPTAAAAAHPDAELLRICRAIDALDAKSDALLDPWADVPGGPPDAVIDRLDAITGQYQKLLADLYVMPALTLDGVRAKARIAYRSLGSYADGAPEESDRLTWSLCRDLLSGIAA